MNSKMLLLAIAIVATATFCQSNDSDSAIAQIDLNNFQKNEIDKKSKSGTSLIISGTTAVVLGGVMMVSWYYADQYDTASQTGQIYEKTPLRAVLGGILGAIGITLDIGGILQKVQAQKLEDEYLQRARDEKVSLYLAPMGAGITYRF